MLQVVTLAIVDDDGNPNYPIDIKKAIVLKTTSTLAGTTVVNALWEDVKLSMWGGLLGCSWHTVPTFGLLLAHTAMHPQSMQCMHSGIT